MLASIMPQKDEGSVRLQVNITAGTRKKLKAVAVESEVEMGDIAEAVFAHILPLLQTGKAPAAITAAIEKIKKARKDAEDAAD